MQEFYKFYSENVIFITLTPFHNIYIVITFYGDLKVLK